MVDVSMTVEVPEPLAGRLAAEAARRGIDPDTLAVEALQAAYGPPAPDQGDEDRDALDAFIGCFDSGDPDWASTDTKVLRAQADARRPA